jgi:hypothetical protein
MSALWSDMALARVAWAKAENCDSAERGKATPAEAEWPLTVSRPERRVLHPSWMSSSFRHQREVQALKRLSQPQPDCAL